MLYPRTTSLHSWTLSSFKSVPNHSQAVQKVVSRYMKCQNNETDHWVIPNRVYTRQRSKIEKTTRSLALWSNWDNRTVRWESSHVCALCYSRIQPQAQNGPYNVQKRMAFPYRISMLHELKQEDYTPHYNYCNCFLKKIGSVIKKMTTFFSDKAWFYLSGYVNSQNYSIRSTNNLHVFEETSLHPIKVGIWCAISKHRVVGPIFFW